MTVISLMTDFGEQDEYVGVMKGVILAAAPEARIVDLCHRIGPQDVAGAAFMIEAAFRYFPPRTLHVLVVDPGVGGMRRILYAEAGDHRFLCPDNGLLTIVAQPTGLAQTRQVTNRDLFGPSVSRTFHGRDIFAPLAAFLIQGGDPAQLGGATPPEGIERLAGWIPQFSGDGPVKGRIVSTDRFGNLVTNIPADLLARLLADDPGQTLQIDMGRQLTTHLHKAYEEASPGEVLAIIGSRQMLEIAINQGSARDHFQVESGCFVTVAAQRSPAVKNNQ
ncbi:MAG: SAM-dependent chlorinase/fluorinase [Desulfosarcina sp.]|nr:SAM-dependent chlorinase/fluorinase [Desulfobacterales bacterium]